VRIATVETRRYRHPIDPPLNAAWDPEPRRFQDATVVTVTSDDGVTGHASGDSLPDVALLEQLVTGVDPFRTELVRDLCETCDFHGARPWTLEVAVWDLVGRALDQPLWRLLGGRSERIAAYASAAHMVDAGERARRAVALRDAGIGAIKLRFGLGNWRADIEAVATVRDAVGKQMAIMVDANQGWRMPGDVRPRWDVAEAAQCARELEALDVYWLEEPLATDDIDGYVALRRRTDLRLAAGEMVRQPHEARDLIVRGGVDVIQTDVVLSGGIGGCRRVSALADLHRRAWSPHTWSNGYGLVANLHAALAFSSAPFLEVPFDPPEWSASARDWLLPQPVEIAADGTIAPPPGPGLGIEPDFDRLEQWRVA
jgi:L-alanine-DL-glutamate epimerase-like enolase superfamily enzyme